ncbi:MAG: hypothetical protein GF364_13855, partial [Candidatus Lokiarchaeota archaeon]|nr:hypothetical protein [Candidatus Lokiarchaeota archaeon]
FGSIIDEVSYYVIDFINNGPQIDEKDLINLFNPFYTTKKTGTGLGLSISLSIVKKHNGFITIKSTENYTSFRIYIPS